MQRWSAHKWAIAVARLVCIPFAAMASPKWMDAMALSVVAQYKSSVGKSYTGGECSGGSPIGG